MKIRLEQDSDIHAIHKLNASVFDTSAEAELVDKLRDSADPILSLVAEEQQNIIGHIMFSPATLISHAELHIMALAPMAVDKSLQSTGIGSALVELGLSHCKEIGCGAVVVLGHPDYYPRFGFQASINFNLSSEYDVPEDTFMVMELSHNYLQGKSGIIKYHHTFDEV